MTSKSFGVGAVVIGRNEGPRLRLCLRSLITQTPDLVYVDSGSSDGSASFARSLGVNVVELSLSKPFTMGRGRNAGLTRLLEINPALDFVQFVDGDCEVLSGWIDQAEQALRCRPEVAVVSGRRSERYPESSIYNRLCDLEWDTPAGESRACHGDAMMRVLALRQVGVFSETMIAGEEAELCLRLRRAGWKILRLDVPMTLHDAGIESFGQWWTRATRSGHAYAEGAWMHGLTKERHNVRPIASILFWTLGIPASVIGVAWLISGLSALLLTGYGVLWWRVAREQTSRGRSKEDARLYSTFTVVGKFAQLVGVVRFIWYRFLMRRQHGGLIEYKAPSTAGRASVSTLPRGDVGNDVDKT